MKKLFVVMALVIVLCMAFAACTNKIAPENAEQTPAAAVEEEGKETEKVDDANADGAIKIGISFGTFQEERWHRELEAAQARAAEVGAEIFYKDADHDANLQNQHIEEFVTQGMDTCCI